MTALPGVNGYLMPSAAPAVDPWKEKVVALFSQLEKSMPAWTVTVKGSKVTLFHSTDRTSTQVEISYQNGLLHGTLRKGEAGCLHLDLVGVRELALVDEGDRQEVVGKGLEELIESLSKVGPDEYYFDISGPPSPELPKQPIPAPRLGANNLHLPSELIFDASIDEASTSLAGGEGVEPLHQNKEAIPESDQIKNVDEAPC